MKVYSILICFLLGCCKLGISQVKSYSVSPQPNYYLSKKNDISSILTDGKFVGSNSFWTDPATMGWQNTKKITIELNLGSSRNISKIQLSTVTGLKAGVHLPLNIFVFESPDKIKYRLVGDVMDKYKNLDEYYKPLKLSLDKINLNSKYIKIVIVPKSGYFFLDEIILTEGGASTSSKNKAFDYSNQNLDKLVSSNEKNSNNNQFLNNEYSSLKKLGLTGSNLDEIKKSLDAGKMSLTYDQAMNKLAMIAAQKSEDKAFAAILPKWSSTKSQSERILAIGTKSTDIALSSPFAGAKDFFVVKLSNFGSRQKAINLAINGTGSSYIKVFSAVDVRTKNYDIVSDALDPWVPNSSITLKPYETKLLYFYATSNKAGISNSNIIFTDLSSGALKTFKIKLTQRILLNSLKYAPNVNTWAYFNYPLLSSRQKSAIIDLNNHYNYTYVVPPSVLYGHSILSLTNYVKSFLNGRSKILLYVDYGKLVKGKRDDKFNSSFLKWYDEVVAFLGKSGIQTENLYLYPYDELKPNEVNSFIDFSSWIKKNRPKSNIYLTVANQEAFVKALKYADVFQVHASQNMMNFLKTLDVSKIKPKIWLYDTKAPSKSLDPYQYYRMLPWKAFLVGSQGIGFWNYADVGWGKGETSVWDDFDGNKPDYSVVYDKGTQLISSVRWEAFKIGTEDFMLLKLYSERFGKVRALKMCKTVLDSHADVSLADKVRRSMISELSGEN